MSRQPTLKLLEFRKGMRMLFILLTGNPMCSGAAEEAWIDHHRFEDFVQGTFENGGQNLYVTAEGILKRIHVWDLNRDSFPDLIVGHSHNASDNEDLFIYPGGRNGPESLMPNLPEHQPLGRILHHWSRLSKEMTFLSTEGAGPALAVDLNGDNRKEIVFCNFTHNHEIEQPAYLYWNDAEGFSEDRLTKLPTLTAVDVTAADFNQDGFIDLCFANMGSELGGRFDYYGNRESTIYWNGPLRFSDKRKTSLSTLNAQSCSAGDLNEDGFPDLVFVNRQDGSNYVSIHYNGPDGFLPNPVHHEAIHPRAVEIVEVEHYPNPFLVVLNDSGASLYPSTPEGVSPKPSWVFQVPTATTCLVEDLNRDGYSDLMFPRSGQGKDAKTSIFYGSPDGFSPENRQDLPGLGTSDAAIADFNGDGWKDIVLANKHDGQTYDVNSYLYWNSPKGFHPEVRLNLQGLGPVAVLAEDFNGDDYPEVALINRHSGARSGNETSPGTYIYWGNDRGVYSSTSMATLETTSEAMAVADFNQDNWPDIVFPNGKVFFGKDSGFSKQADLNLHLSGYAVSIADLNRDGFLDLVIPAKGEAYVFWGNEESFHPDRSLVLPLKTSFSLSVLIADFNNDHLLDLLFPDVDTPTTEIFWGLPDRNFSPEQKLELQIHPSATVETADLNDDGWLDLVYGGSYDVDNYGRHLRYGKILYGASDGYDPKRTQHFEAFDSNEQAIADLNKDGVLDLVVGNYHGYTTRSLPLFIYWGKESEPYHSSRRTSLPGESVSRVTVLDLNQDDWLDIVAFNHQKDGFHTADAVIFWGSPEGYSFQNRQSFPAFGVHFGRTVDYGNLKNRTTSEAYTSPPLTLPRNSELSEVTWEGETPANTGIDILIRSSQDRPGLDKAEWNSPDSILEQSSSLSFPDKHQWFQYRILLHSRDGANTPTLKRIQFH